MYLKIAVGNIRRAVSDYSVYFLTLVLAACLLYAFTSSMDYLLGMDLTDRQRSLCEVSSGITDAFSIFMVIVFAFLVLYANRFILRRRAREFAVYGMLGMGACRIALILLLEGAIVGLFALLIGLALGVVASPLFGIVAAFVFDVPWSFRIELFGDAVAWTSGCFCALMAIATLLGIRWMRKRTLVELLNGSEAAARKKGRRHVPRALQPVVGLALNIMVWGACVLQPMYFIGLIIPMGFAAVLGTGLLFRHFVARVPERRRRRRPEWYWRGLNCFVIRQIESKVDASATAMACTCVLMAAAICMMVAGLAFSVGMRMGSTDLLEPQAFAPIGYIGVFYGLTFLLSAAAVLALQQLSEGVESIGRFDMLAKLGASGTDRRRAVRRQVAVYFAVPFLFALVHCVFGLTLVGFLAFIVGSGQFPQIIACTVGVTFALLCGYCVITCRQSMRMLVG